MKTNNFFSWFIVLAMCFHTFNTLVAEEYTNDSELDLLEDLLDPDSLKYCSFLPRRDRTAIKERIWDITPPFEPTADILDILTWLAEAARKGNMLVIDERYGSCLGCMNYKFPKFIEKMEARQEIIYGVIDFEDITGLDYGSADQRRPYNLINIERGYKFAQYLTFGKYQSKNFFKKIESYPLVPPHQRDGEGEPYEIEENQKRRIFTRAHFPNLMMIDGKKINKNALNALCAQASRINIRFIERPDGIHQPEDTAFQKMIQDVLPAGAMMSQMVGPNLYYTGSETAGDFLFQQTIDTIECVLHNQKYGINQSCSMFVRDGYPYFTSEENTDQ